MITEVTRSRVPSIRSERAATSRLTRVAHTRCGDSAIGDRLERRSRVRLAVRLGRTVNERRLQRLGVVMLGLHDGGCELSRSAQRVRRRYRWRLPARLRTGARRTEPLAVGHRVQATAIRVRGPAARFTLTEEEDTFIGGGTAYVTETLPFFRLQARLRRSRVPRLTHSNTSKAVARLVPPHHRSWPDASARRRTQIHHCLRRLA